MVQSLEGRRACFRPWTFIEPVCYAKTIHCRSCRQVVQSCFVTSNVACVSHAAAPNSLRYGSLDASALRVRFPEFRGFLARPLRLQRLVLLVRMHRDRAML